MGGEDDVGGGPRGGSRVLGVRVPWRLGRRLLVCRCSDGFAHGLFVDDAASGDDDDVCGWFHEGDAAFVDGVHRFVGVGAGDYEPVGHGDEVVEFFQAPYLFGMFGWSGEFVDGVDVHVEAGGAFGNSASDVSEAVDAEGCAFEFDLTPFVGVG